jgi:hypothetical protein
LDFREIDVKISDSTDVPEVTDPARWISVERYPVDSLSEITRTWKASLNVPIDTEDVDWLDSSLIDVVRLDIATELTISSDLITIEVDRSDVVLLEDIEFEANLVAVDIVADPLDTP